MLQRMLIIFGLTTLLLILLQEFGGPPDSYFAMHVRKSGGQPYLLLQQFSSSMEPGTPYLSLYTPKGPPDKARIGLDEWEPVLLDRQGPAYAMFNIRVQTNHSTELLRTMAAVETALLEHLGTDPRVSPAAALLRHRTEIDGEQKYSARHSERLALLHQERITYIDVAQRPAVVSFDTLPFKWTAETAAEIKGTPYIFGVDVPRPIREDAQKIKGTLKAARFNGNAWEEVSVAGPEVESARVGFTLEAVPYNNTILLLWRDMEMDQMLAPTVEGPRVVTHGPVHTVVFDGAKFAEDVNTVNGLPRGNATAWNENGEIRFLIQTRHSRDEPMGRSSPMEIWGMLPGNPAVKVETIAQNAPKPGILAHIAAEHVRFEGQEFILRSNWQKFEVWRKDDAGWTLAAPNPKGLPTYNIETMLLSSLFMGLAVIAFTAGIAYRKRWLPGQRVHPREIYATLGLRMGAYAVDLGLIFGLLILVSSLQGWSYISPIELLDVELGRSKLPFIALYLAYLVLTEWLLGASVGKYIMGLRVVTDNGDKLTLWSAAVRNLVGFFERMPPYMVMVPMFMIIFTPRRQRLGDLLSRTYVVQRNAFEAFKAQRAADIAQRKQDEAQGLPELEEEREKVGSSNDKNDR